MHKRPRLEPQKEDECDQLVDAYELFLLKDAKPTDDQADRLRQDTMRMWPFLRTSHLSKIVWVVCRVDSVELYWFLVSLGLDLSYKQGVLPVELAIRANAIEIMESLQGKIVYQDCVTSGRLVIEAMHQGDPEHLRCLLSLGASMDESHGKYGTALEMSIWQGLQIRPKLHMFPVFYNFCPVGVKERLTNLRLCPVEAHELVEYAVGARRSYLLSLIRDDEPVQQTRHESCDWCKREHRLLFPRFLHK